MPTRAEQDELRNYCTWERTTLNGIEGYKVISKKNGNSIFLPAAGYRVNSNLYDAGSYGLYWSSLLYTSNSSNAYYLYFLSSVVVWNNDYRYFGLSVRPVCERAQNLPSKTRKKKHNSAPASVRLVIAELCFNYQLNLLIYKQGRGLPRPPKDNYNSIHYLITKRLLPSG